MNTVSSTTGLCPSLPFTTDCFCLSHKCKLIFSLCFRIMSSFPSHTWEVRDIQDFETLTVPAPAGSKFHLQALLTAPPCPGREGQFKLIIGGEDHMLIKAKVRDIIDDPIFEGMSLECQLQLGSQIVLGKNACTSRWVDVVELVKAQDIEVYDETGEAVSEAFIESMETYQARHSGANMGIVWRWLVAYKGKSNQLNLMVQALPCDLNKIKASAALREEHTKGIILLIQPINYTSFSNIEGPIPIFFSEDPASTGKHLKDSPDFALGCLRALAERLLLVGEISRYFFLPKHTFEHH